MALVGLATPVAACTDSKQPFAFEQITVSTAAVGLTTATWNLSAPATCAEIRVEVDDVRYRMDGTNPTSSVGINLDSGDVLYLSNGSRTNNLARAKFIRSGSNDATLSVQYWR